MADRPIIFSGPMVRALLDGRKTQTRRLATSPLRRAEHGDRLWVRESFHPWKGSASGKTIVYVADDRWIDWGSGENFIDKVQWLTSVTPSIHMPRWASRLTLIVESASIEPLNSISEADAIAEGIVEHATCGWHVPGVDHPMKEFPILSRPTPREMYAALWDCLHGAGEWLGNPDVLALKFRVVTENIDRIAA